MIYSDGVRSTKVYGLYLVCQYRRPQYGNVLEGTQFSLVPLSGMQSIHGKGGNFLMNCDPRKGGTVVPPCDFHPISLKNPLNTRVPEVILSGTRPPPRATRVGMISSGLTKV